MCLQACLCGGWYVSPEDSLGSCVSHLWGIYTVIWCSVFSGPVAVINILFAFSISISVVIIRGHQELQSCGPLLADPAVVDITWGSIVCLCQAYGHTVEMQTLIDNAKQEQKVWWGPLVSALAFTHPSPSSIPKSSSELTLSCQFSCYGPTVLDELKSLCLVRNISWVTCASFSQKCWFSIVCSMFTAEGLRGGGKKVLFLC